MRPGDLLREEELARRRGQPPRTRIRSYRNSEENAGLAFGTMVALSGATDARRTTTLVDVLAGVVVRQEKAARLRVQDDAYLPRAMASVLTHGAVYVAVERAVKRGDPVHVRVHGAGEPGVFGSAGEIGTHIDISLFARWLEGGADVALLELDMTNYRRASNGGLALLTDNAGIPLVNNAGEYLYASAG